MRNTLRTTRYTYYSELFIMPGRYEGQKQNKPKKKKYFR